MCQAICVVVTSWILQEPTKVESGVGMFTTDHTYEQKGEGTELGRRGSSCRSFLCNFYKLSLMYKQTKKLTLAQSHQPHYCFILILPIFPLMSFFCFWIQPRMAFSHISQSPFLGDVPSVFRELEILFLGVLFLYFYFLIFFILRHYKSFSQIF